ncbi:hypothetical protein DRJ16_06410, partial [Candidatus Woesearchaeota archaeon]
MRTGLILMPVLMIFCLSFLTVPSLAQDNTIRYWALIINGDSSFIADTDYMYHTLTHHYVFDGVYYLSPSFPHPGVNARATKANVRSAITDWLTDHSDSNDIVLIYFSGHGGGYHHEHRSIEGGRIDISGDEGSEVRESTLGYDANNDGDTDDWVGIDECLWIGNEQYWDDEMREDLSTLNYGRLIIILDAGAGNISRCFSGGFIDDISATNRVVMTATNETTYAWGDRDRDGFSEWSEVFIDALYGNNTHYDNGNIVIDNPINADVNGDGYVSIKEAWDYAWNNDDARLLGLTTPWLDDDGNGLPTFVNERDVLDPDDGAVADSTWLPLHPTLNVISPTRSSPASAGAYDNPNHIQVTVEVTQGLPSTPPITGLTMDNFTIKIGGKEATASIIDTSIPGRYVFDVAPPEQESPGKYDLEVILKYKGIETTDIEKEAVEYTAGKADVMLIIDRSGSMRGQKIRDAKNSAKLFVDYMRDG